jgi:hypothetical protein
VEHVTSFTEIISGVQPSGWGGGGLSVCGNFLICHVSALFPKKTDDERRTILNNFLGADHHPTASHRHARDTGSWFIFKGNAEARIFLRITQRPADDDDGDLCY